MPAFIEPAARPRRVRHPRTTYLGLEVALTMSAGGVESGDFFWKRQHRLNQQELLKALGAFVAKNDLYRSIVLEGLKREPYELAAFITGHHEAVVAAFPGLRKVYRYENQHSSHLADRFRQGLEYLVNAAKANELGPKAMLLMVPIQGDEYRMILSTGYGYAMNATRTVAALTGLKYVDARKVLKWDEQPIKDLLGRFANDRGWNLTLRNALEI